MIEEPTGIGIVLQEGQLYMMEAVGLLLPVDRALLGPVAYLRNFELTLHGDWTAFDQKGSPGSLYSVGADFAAVLGNLLWVPYRTRIGVSYNYNGGASFDSFAVQGLAERHRFSLVFNIDM